jgi:hypothetical protein
MSDREPVDADLRHAMHSAAAAIEQQLDLAGLEEVARAHPRG